MTKNLIKIDETGNTFLYKDDEGNLYGLQKWHLPHDTEPVLLTGRGPGVNVIPENSTPIAAEEDLGMPVVIFKRDNGDFFLQEHWWDWKTNAFGFELKASDTEAVYQKEIKFIHDLNEDGFIGEPSVPKDPDPTNPKDKEVKVDEIDRVKPTKKIINSNISSNDELRGNRSPGFTGLASRNVSLLLEIRNKSSKLIASKTVKADSNGFWTAQFDTPFTTLDYLPDGELFELFVHQQRSDLSQVKDSEPLDFLVDLQPPDPLSLSSIEGRSMIHGIRDLKSSNIKHKKLGPIHIYKAKKDDTLSITGVSKLLQKSFRTNDQSKKINLRVVVKDINNKTISSTLIRDNVALSHRKENEWTINTKIGEDEIYSLNFYHVDASGNESNPIQQYIYVKSGKINKIKLSDEDRSDHLFSKLHNISNSKQPTFVIDATQEAKRIVAYDHNDNRLGESITKDSLGNWIIKLSELKQNEYGENETFNFKIVALDKYDIQIDAKEIDYTLDTRQELATSSSSTSKELDYIEGKTSGELFGSSVAIAERGYRVAVSAPKRLIGKGQKRGAIDVFVAPFAEDLKQVGTSIENPNPTNDFGYAIKMAGDGHIVFATTPSYAGQNANQKGIIQVFQSTNRFNDNLANWRLIQTIPNQEEGILGRELRIDYAKNQLFASLGPSNDLITKEIVFDFNKTSGTLSKNQIIPLEKPQAHEQINNQIDRQIGTARKSVNTFGYSIAGNPNSSNKGFNTGSITYNVIDDLPATLTDNRNNEITSIKPSYYTTNSNLIFISGNIPEFKSRIEIDIQKPNRASKPAKSGQFVDDNGNWQFQLPSSIISNEGDYKVSLITKDIAGNPINYHQSQGFTVNIDRTAPNLNRQEIKLETQYNSQSKQFKSSIKPISAKVAPHSMVKLYYQTKSNQWKLNNIQTVRDDGLWNFKPSRLADMKLNQKKEASYRIDVINTNTDSKPVFSGVGEVGGTVEVFSDDLEQQSRRWKKVGQVKVNDKGSWSLSTDKGMDSGRYNFGFKITDQAGNQSKLISWMQNNNKSNDAIHVTEETTKLLNPKLQPINDSSIINTELNQYINDLPIVINNKGSFKKGAIRSNFGKAPWKFAKVVTGSDKKTQAIKDLERAKQLFNITYTLGKKWLSTNENTDEKLEFNIYTSFLTGSKAMGIITDTLSDYQNARHAKKIRNFHDRFKTLSLGSITTNYPAGLTPKDFSSTVKYNQLRKNQDQFTAFHRNQYNQSLGDESRARKMIAKYKTILTKELKERQLSYDYGSESTMSSRNRNYKRIKRAENNLKQAQTDLFKAVNQKRIYEWSNIGKQYTLDLATGAKSERLKTAKSVFKLANPALGIGSKALNWNLSGKKKNDLFTAQQIVGLSKDFTEVLDASIDIVQKTPLKKYVIDAQGNVTKKAKNVSSALSALGTGLSVAGSSLEIGNYANRIEEIKAIDCSKLFKVQKDIDKCRNDNKREIELLQGDIALRGTEAGLATMEGLVGVASTGVKAGTKMAKFLKVGGPVLGAAATAVSLFDNSQILEFEKQRANINGIRKKIDTDFSAELLAEGLTAQLAVKEGFNTASKIVDGVTGIGGVVASAIPGGQPVALAAALLGGAITTALSFIEASRLEEEAMKIKDKMTTNSSGNKQTVEQFFDGSFLKQQQQLYDQINPQVDELLSKKAYDEVVAINSQFLKDTDVELAGMTNSGGELGKSAKHFVGTRKKNGDKSWENNETVLDPNKGTITLNEAAKKNRYVSFFAPLNASGKERWTKVKQGKNKLLHQITIDDLKGWDIKDGGQTNSTFDLNDNIVTQAYKSLSDQKKNRLTKIGIDIYGEQGSDQYYANIASINFSGGGRYRSNNEKDYDSASYNTPRLVDKLASGIIISPSQSDFIEIGFTSTSPEERLSQLEAHLKQHLDSASTRDADIQDILDIVKQYKGPKGADHGLRSRNGLVVKPMKEGVSYFKNSIKQHEKKGGKGKRDQKFEYQALDKATNNKTQRIQDQLHSVEVIATTPKADFVDLTGLQMVKQLFTGDGDDHIYSGDNEDDMTIDSGGGNDIINLDNRPKVIQTGEGNDKIIMNYEYINHSHGVDGRTHWPVTNNSNTKEFQVAKTYIDAGQGTDTVIISDAVMDYVKNDYSQLLFNQQASMALGSSLGDSTGQLGDKFNTMLPTDDLKVDTFIEGVEWFEYKLPSKIQSWMPQKLSNVARRKNEALLSFSSPALNGVSTGIPQLDTTFFLSDYKNALNTVFKSNANFEFSAENSNKDLFIMGTPGSDKITSGMKNDVLVGGDGNNVIRSVSGNDIIYPGPDKDIIHIDDTPGHRFIVGITPDDLNKDILHLPMGLYNKHNDDLVFVFKNGKGTVTLVDYYDVKRKIKNIFTEHGAYEDPLHEWARILSKRSSNCKKRNQPYYCKVTPASYQSFLNNNSFYRDIADIDVYSNTAELAQATADSLGL